MMWWAIVQSVRLLLRRGQVRVPVDLHARLAELERAEARCDRDRQEQIWRQIYGLEEAQ